jgi:hypothetical protein
MYSITQLTTNEDNDSCRNHKHQSVSVKIELLATSVGFHEYTETKNIVEKYFDFVITNLVHRAFGFINQPLT